MVLVGRKSGNPEHPGKQVVTAVTRPLRGRYAIGPPSRERFSMRSMMHGSSTSRFYVQGKYVSRPQTIQLIFPKDTHDSRTTPN